MLMQLFSNKPLLVVALCTCFVICLSAVWIWSLQRLIGRRTRRLTSESALRQEAEERADRLSKYDDVSGLPKMPQFLHLTDELLKQRGPANRTMLVIKLNDYKRIITSFGYTPAEKLFSDFSQALGAMRWPAVGHVGRATFAGIVDNDDWQLLFSDIHIKLNEMNIDFQPSVVCGIAPCEKGLNAEDLLRRAETALATALHKKRSYAIYDHSLIPKPGDLEVVAEFRRNVGEQLYCVFQPQLDLESGAIVSAEILVRWNSPRFGELPPGYFIPLLEDAGLIGQVTRMVVKEAVSAIKEMRRAGISCKVAVNISARDFQDLSIAEYIRQLSGDDPDIYQNVKVELTETALAESPELVKQEILSLNKLGVAVSIDDFGTGYASINYLRELSIQELKIDRVFIKNILAETNTYRITESLIQLAHNLDLSIIAEGVETEAQLNTLLAMGCDRVQGYLISRPLKFTQLVAFVAGYNKQDSWHHAKENQWILAN